MPSIGEAAHVSGGDDNSVDSRAKRLWFELVQECTKRKIPIRRTPHGDGYLWNGSLQAMALQVWPNLMQSGRMATPQKSFIAEIRAHLKHNKNVLVSPERGQLFISAEYHEPKTKKKQVRQSATLSTNTAEMTVIDRARAVWAKARGHAGDKNLETVEYEGVLFWKVEKPLSYFINAVFPDLHAWEGGRAPIYDFLRSTCNAVNISRDPSTDSEHAWLIRDSWSEGSTVVIFRSVNPDRIDQRAAKLTPHEAGEDREPAPVEVRRVEEAPTEAKKEETVTTEEDQSTTTFTCPEAGCGQTFASRNAMNGHLAAHRGKAVVPPGTGFIKLPDGRVKCDECDAIFKEAASIPGHKKQHYNERREAENEHLKREVRRLRNLKTADVNLTVEGALRVLTEQVENAMTANSTIERMKEQVSKLQDDLVSARDALREKEAELANANKGGDLSTTLDLLQGIVDGVNSGKIAPIRGLADVDDLLRTLRENQ
jgi:hypothetical protein